ncbi:glycosyltransferase family 62 protein [Xylariaceae sp. FL0662B]|nr:glycosyltransferase family 62 protein [Xylariaceae sp. FL0662B]
MRRMRFIPNRLRWSALLNALLVILILFYTLDPWRSSWSCKTLESCLGGRPRVYRHWDGTTGTADLAIGQNQKTLHDGTVFYQRRIVHTTPDTLVLVLGGDGRAWSRGGVYDFVDLLLAARLDPTTVSLGLMTSTAAEFVAAKEAAAPLPFARVAIFLRREEEEEDGGLAAVADADRRRSHTASARNYLMARTLHDEAHVLWVDPGIVEFSEGIMQTMIGHAERRDDVGLITARCSQGLTDNYDRNAWALNHTAEEPLLMGPISDDSREAAARNLVETRTYVGELVDGTGDDDLVPLDSVGGTIIYIRADLVRQGVNFPTFNVVGTTLAREGWVGIETEGICYVASRLEGGGCFVLGGGHHVRHTDLS